MRSRVAFLGLLALVINLCCLGCSGSSSAKAVQSKEDQLAKIAKDKAKATTPPGQTVTPYN